MHTKRRPNNNMNGGSNGQHRQHNNNRPRRFNNNGRPQGGGDDAAGIARTRRNALQSREKYQQMARDAMSSGDRVLSENYLQHADHYHRVILSLPPEEVRPPFVPQQRPQGEQNANGEQQASSENPDAPYTSEQHSEHGNEAESHHHDDAQNTSHELPAFITQPVNPENPAE